MCSGPGGPTTEQVGRDDALVSALRQMSPRGVGCAAEPIDGAADGLLAAELAVIAGAVPRRRAEFAAGRRAARRALATVGIGPEAIGRGERGVPIWPLGTTGSISHAGGWAAAVVVAEPATTRSLGLDLEVVGAVERELWPTLFRSVERTGWSDAELLAPTVAFAAKEAAFKALFPVDRTEREFLEAAVHVVDPTRVTVAFDGRSAPVPVSWRVVGPLVVALASVVWAG
jgi:4'-phosphopantetheinyl transferase EntD